MGRLSHWMDRTFYGSYQDRWDDKMFRRDIEGCLKEGDTVLDLGAGRGSKKEMDFRRPGVTVVGVDPDPVVLDNPQVDEARALEPPEYRIPYPENHFDLIFSNSVVEHLQDSRAFFQEVERVLKPGGTFLAKTPNRKHYVALVASLTPHWFHEFYNKLRGREAKDTFPTTYACNSRAEVLRDIASLELELEEFKIVEGRPEYLRLWFVFYLAGLAYERTVNFFSALESFRCVIFFRLTKR